MRSQEISVDLVLQAYRAGIFPMAETRGTAEIFWVDPRRRGIFPLEGFHVSRSLARTIRKDPFRVSFDTAFERVIDRCADRPETWINDAIRRVFLALHATGDAHSVELWEGPNLVGGVYGLSIGRAFFGESMFSRRRDASKIALAHLVDRLRQQGFVLFDTQFITPHLASLGAIEISREEYRRRLSDAVASGAEFPGPEPVASGQDVLQRITQTS